MLCVEQHWIENRFLSFIAAIHGYPFFTAGKIAFTRLSANALRVFVINSIGDFVLFLGKAAVVVLTVVAGMEMMKAKENVHHLWMLLVLGGVFAYLVAHTFISVYEVTSIDGHWNHTHNFRCFILSIMKNT